MKITLWVDRRSFSISLVLFIIMMHLKVDQITALKSNETMNLFGKNMEISLKGLFWSNINIFEIVLVNTNKHQHLHNMVRVRQSYNYPRWNVKFVEFQAIDIPSSIWVRRVWVKAREREGENNDLNIFMAFCSIHQCYSNHFVTNFEESPTKWK